MQRPYSTQINVWLSDVSIIKLMKKVLSLFETLFFHSFFGKHRSECALLWWYHTLPLLCRICLDTTIFKYKQNIISHFFQRLFDLFLQIFRPHESKKNKGKVKTETESQDHAGMCIGKGKTVLNGAFNFQDIHSQKYTFLWYKLLVKYSQDCKTMYKNAWIPQI